MAHIKLLDPFKKELRDMVVLHTSRIWSYFSKTV